MTCGSVCADLRLISAEARWALTSFYAETDINRGNIRRDAAGSNLSMHSRDIFRAMLDASFKARIVNIAALPTEQQGPLVK